MKSKHLFLCLCIGVSAFFSCVQDKLSVFDAPESLYQNAQVLEPVSTQLNVRLDQKYRTVDLSLEDIGITPQEGAVFYAPHNEKDDWCGEDWYTSEYGFYFGADGNACYLSSPEARLFVEYVDGHICIGQIPDACKAGDTYNVEVGFATVDVKQPVRITINVLEALPWATAYEHEDGLTYTVYQEVNTDYTALEIKINEKAVKAALGLDSLKPLLDAMQSDTAFDTVMRGVDSDGSYDDYNKYTANVAGYWFNQNGDVCEWKGEKWGAFIEWDRTSPMIFRLGQAVENNVPGSRYDMKIALIHGDKEAVLTFKLMIVAEVTDDLGLL